MARIIISGEYARLIQPFVSKEETRYYLNGFHVEPHPEKGVFIVATDGHRLGCFYDKNGTCDRPAIVSLNRFTLAQLAPQKKKGALARFLIVDLPENGHAFSSARANVYEGNASQPDGLFVAAQGECIIDGTFPDWRRVLKFPDAKLPPASPTFNAAYVAAFSLPRSLDAKGPRTIRFFARNEADPTIVFTGRDDFFGVLMPMRSDVPTAEMSMPTWFAPAPAIAAAAPEAATVS